MSLAIRVDPTIVDPRGAHGNRARLERHLPSAALAVADHQGVSFVVAIGAMRLQVHGDLDLQSRHEHPARPLAGDLVEQGSPVHLVLRRLVADPQHGWRLLPVARPGAAVDQTGGYAAGVTGSTIHNLWSYLKEAHPGGSVTRRS